MKENYKLYFVLVAILFGAGGFACGWVVKSKQQTKAMTAGGFAINGQFPGGATGRRFGGLGGGGRIAGTVISKDATSITVKLVNGSTKTVYTSGTTTYSKQVTASGSDVNTGQTVLVNGTANSDGSVTANSISLTTGLPTNPTSTAPTTTN